MINNSALLKWDRLKQKQLSQQFIYEITEGLNCSAFEAQAAAPDSWVFSEEVEFIYRRNSEYWK